MKYSFLIALLLFSPSAHATVSHYANPTFGYSLDYPDNWMPQSENGDMPHTYRIVADEGRARAHCQITSEPDRRFVIYGPQPQAELMQRELGPAFWNAHLADNKNVTYIDVRERSGLGNGAATRVLVDYTTPQDMPMRAWMAATIHDGVRYTAECAATQESFANYEKTFHSIVATLKMPPAFAPFPNGFHSDFTNDKEIYFPLAEGSAVSEF